MLAFYDNCQNVKQECHFHYRYTVCHSACYVAFTRCWPNGRNGEGSLWSDLSVVLMSRWLPTLLVIPLTSDFELFVTKIIGVEWNK